MAGRTIRCGTEEEWRAFGAVIFRLRNELQNEGLKYQGLLPLKVTNVLLKATRFLDEFRNQAESEMFKRGGPKDKNIWHPGQ